MKIVSFGEFAKLPTGTIYSYYEPCICTGLYRKLETINDEDGHAIDFFEISLVAECQNGEPPSLDESPCRWGLFDYNAQFAVYEPEDIEMIKANL